MAIARTKAAQETAVDEGLALGCVALGVGAVMGSKMDIELAFVRAWNDWPYRSEFPVVRADIHRNSLLGLLRASSGRRSAHLTGWSSAWPFVPYLHENWTIEDAAAVLGETCGVPLAGWIQLAGAFTKDLNAASGGDARS
jgi:hypothetical protein